MDAEVRRCLVAVVIAVLRCSGESDDVNVE